MVFSVEDLHTLARSMGWLLARVVERNEFEFADIECIDPLESVQQGCEEGLPQLLV